MSLPQLERETSRLNEVKCVKDFQTRRLIYFLSSLPTASSSSEGVVLVLFLFQLFFFLSLYRQVSSPSFSFSGFLWKVKRLVSMREATFSSKRELEQIDSENQRAFSLEIGRSLSKIRR